MARARTKKRPGCGRLLFAAGLLPNPYQLAYVSLLNPLPSGRQRVQSWGCDGKVCAGDASRGPRAVRDSPYASDPAGVRSPTLERQGPGVTSSVSMDATISASVMLST